MPLFFKRPENVNEKLDDFVNGLNKVDLGKYFLGEKDNSVIYAPGHGKGLYLGPTKILSLTFKYALVEKLQKRFLNTAPDKISQLLTHAYQDQCMNFPSNNQEWHIQNRIIFDPEAKYAELSAQSAVSLNNKDENLKINFWANFLDLSPSKTQLEKYQSAAAFLKSSAPHLWEDYRYLQEFLQDKKYAPIDWKKAVANNHPSYITTMDEEKKLLEHEPYLYDDKNPRIKSRKIVHTNPEKALSILMGENPRDDKQRMKDEVVPVLHSRAENLASLDKQFADNTELYLSRATYIQGAYFSGTETRNDVFFFIQQSATRMLGQYVERDVMALKYQTSELRYLRTS